MIIPECNPPEVSGRSRKCNVVQLDFNRNKFILHHFTVSLHSKFLKEEISITGKLWNFPNSQGLWITCENWYNEYENHLSLYLLNPEWNLQFSTFNPLNMVIMLESGENWGKTLWSGGVYRKNCASVLHSNSCNLLWMSTARRHKKLALFLFISPLNIFKTTNVFGVLLHNFLSISLENSPSLLYNQRFLYVVVIMLKPHRASVFWEKQGFLSCKKVGEDKGNVIHSEFLSGEDPGKRRVCTVKKERIGAFKCRKRSKLCACL